MSFEDDLERLDQQLDFRLKRLKGLRSSATHDETENHLRVLENAQQCPSRIIDHTLNNVCETVSRMNVTQNDTKEENLTERGNETPVIHHEDHNRFSTNKTDHSANNECQGVQEQRQTYSNKLDNEPRTELSAPLAKVHNQQEADAQHDEEDSLKEEEQDAIFDEFLDQSTRYRISSLCKKVTHLNSTIKLLQEECKRLSDGKKEACAKAHAAETERRTLSKQVSTMQQQISKSQKSNKQLQERVQELNAECQALRKEIATNQHSLCERRTNASSLQTQLTRAQAENASLRDQMSTLKTRHKEELDQLRGALGNSNSKAKELERQQRNLSALAKKQDRLIGVLCEQKNNLAAAKAAACLEEKFLAVITPLQPP